MAFRMPQQRQQPSRPAPLRASQSSPTAPSLSRQQESLRDRHASTQSQEWILFSPNDARDLAGEDSTQKSTRTVGQLSDFGSLETAAISEKIVPDDIADENETEDLDSLDDGLHAFNEPLHSVPSRPLNEQGGDTVLPTHDGLGTFPGSSYAVQQQFWQTERYNPRRRRHSLRRASLQRQAEALEQEDDTSIESDKFARIEKWRMEQSRAILDEIEKETRRRRRRSNLSASSSQPKSLKHSMHAGSSAPASVLPDPKAQQQEGESLWEKFTRKIMRDIMGLDDATLSYIFGESLPTDEEDTHDPGSNRRDIDISTPTELAGLTETWTDKVLSRVAKELGHFVWSLSEHPGAFSTYLKTQEPIPYASIVALEANSTQCPFRPVTQISKRRSKAADPRFSPTLKHQRHKRRQSLSTADPSLWGIEEEEEMEADNPHAECDPYLNRPFAPNAREQRERLRQEKEYWERDLDVKMVFSFLKSRLSSSPSQQEQASQQKSSHYSTPATVASSSSGKLPFNPGHPDNLRRAALIRHHHPLVSRNLSRSNGKAPASVPGDLWISTNTKPTSGLIPSATRVMSPPASVLSPVLGRRPSSQANGSESCASQSTKRSKTARSGSSRNYWDWAGPGDFGTGGSSLLGGPVGGGSWGEV